MKEEIIHSALQNDKFCTTKSEGDEPYRHVVVMLKERCQIIKNILLKTQEKNALSLIFSLDC